MNMFTVRLLSKGSGSPVTGTSVGVSIGNDGVKHEYTDDQGNADFDWTSQQNSSVYVSGKTVYTGRLEGRTIVYM
jgi:hypothetical protein